VFVAVIAIIVPITIAEVITVVMIEEILAPHWQF
jgi:hypothetical protein